MDGTAEAGPNHTRISGTLTFATGGTQRRCSCRYSTMSLMTAAAAIEKSDAMPQARQVRFGRTAASYTAAAAGRIALLVAHVIRQLRTQRPLQQRLLQLGGSARHHPTGPPAVLGRPEAHSDFEASASPASRVHRVWLAVRFAAMVVAGRTAGTAAGSEGPGSRGVFPEPENPFHVIFNQSPCHVRGRTR